MSAMRAVRPERTNWRDMELSNRHRRWGFNCPAVDLDFLMVEYNLGLPVALVDYKQFLAQMPNTRHPTYRAICALADREPPLPFLVVFYWPDVWAFRVYPVNETGHKQFKYGEELTEREYVTRLYRLRSLLVEQQILDRLNNTKPPKEANTCS